MTTGWTFTKGSAGNEVDKDAVIYSSKSCLSIVRTGANPTQAVSEITGLDNEEAEAVVKEYKKEQTAYEKAKQEYDIKFNELQLDYLQAQSKYNTARNSYNNHVYSEMAAEDWGLPSEFDLESELKEVNKLEADMKAKENDMNSYARAFHDKWKTSTALTEAVTPEPPIIKAQEEVDKELEELTDTISKMNLNMSTTAEVTAWFDAVEAYIDNLPQFKEDTTPLYEVEKQGTKWIYTGNAEIPDPEYNKKIREWKQNQCKKINSLIDSVTAELEKKLNDLSKKCVYIMPLIEAIKVIQGGVSIDTLVKWGKGVINFCTSIYQMFYTTYKTVMEVMELVVVRVPQLLSKMINKVTELDCPVEVKSIHVDVKGNIAQANKERQEKKKKGQSL